MNRRTPALLAGFLLIALPSFGVESETVPSAARVLVVDGSAVHDVGATRLNVTNWGLIGSRPGTAADFSSAPSLEFPAGSGQDLLFAAGLWFGARVAGVPHVSTGQYQPEILPDPEDALDKVWVARPGRSHRKRYPMRNPDDDRDGVEDEDPLNGRDDDGDRRIDEDWAMIGEQYFRASMRDDRALASDFSPDHQPMGIEVVQESFQWGQEAYSAFVGFRYTVTNRSSQPLEQAVVGMFADFDIGSAADDLAGFHHLTIEAFDGSPIEFAIAYTRDAVGSGPVAGVAIVGPGSRTASFDAFSGNLPFDSGGDPTNDAERYSLLSTPGFDRPPTDPAGANDYRLLVSSGPLGDLLPGEAAVLDVAFVVGADLEDLVRNASNAARLAYGARFDRDGDPSTGPDGREFQVPWYRPAVRGRHGGAPTLRMSVLPNPSNPRVQVEFELPARETARLDVYDVRGRHVASIFDEVVDAGVGRRTWDGTDIKGRVVASGVYFLRLEQAGRSSTARAVIVR